MERSCESRWRTDVCAEVGVLLRADQAQRRAVREAERLVVEMVGEQDIVLQGIFDEHDRVGCVNSIRPKLPLSQRAQLSFFAQAETQRRSMGRPRRSADSRAAAGGARLLSLSIWV